MWADWLHNPGLLRVPTAQCGGTKSEKATSPLPSREPEISRGVHNPEVWVPNFVEFKSISSTQGATFVHLEGHYTVD